LNDKAAYAHRVVTRMCFDPVVTTGWAQHIARDGVALQVIAGMPGPVNRQKLIRISASLGLGSSARFLQKQHGLWRFFLPGAYNPHPPPQGPRRRRTARHRHPRRHLQRVRRCRGVAPQAASRRRSRLTTAGYAAACGCSARGDVG